MKRYQRRSTSISQAAAKQAMENLPNYLAIIKQYEQPEDIKFLNVLKRFIQEDRNAVMEEQNNQYDEMCQAFDRWVDTDCISKYERKQADYWGLKFEYSKLCVKKYNYVLRLCENQIIYIKEKQLRSDYFERR